jgi:ABC-type oligopeptide transport system substrate-binding subunit
MIWEYRKTLSCIKCKLNNASVLAFHHIDSKLKNFGISQGYWRKEKIINEEIAKTVCLCYNCHEEFHYTYRQHKQFSKTNQTQLEQYLGKKVIPLKIDIEDYTSVVEQNVSKFYDLPFLIT